MVGFSNTVQTLESPSDTLRLAVGLGKDGAAWYELHERDKVIIRRSQLTLFTSDEQNLLQASEEPRYHTTEHDETWEQPWGEQRLVRNHYHELSLETDTFTIRFRLFDEALGFRYELKGEGELILGREATEFNIDSDSHAWWIPALGRNHYEHLYKKTLIGEIDTAHTPLTVELPDNTYVAIHEAALYDYGALNLVPSDKGLTSTITPLTSGDAAAVTLPFTVPWRTAIVSDTAVGLLSSKVMLNLNEPSKIADTSWIQPMKFMGIWWGMFISHFTWSSGPKHGATTANAFRYINAARDLGIRGLLIEGWNEGWDGDWTQNGDKMNHLQPYPDFDIHAVTAYAKKQGIELVGHHETSGNMGHYEWQLPEAYDYYKLFDVQYIKTGYVSPRVHTGDFHSSQTGVRHYQKTVEFAAERQIMLDIHEPVKGTGIERTWPNLMTREGVMGQEYEGTAVIPEHTAILPFTRLLAGPLDYTPGLFNLDGTERRVQTTLAKQLAFYVTLYSPMQMVADLPEHYAAQPAFQFIREVPVSWEETRPLDGVIGDYYIVARKDRSSDDWYIGGVADEEQRSTTISLDFLESHRSYEATIYRDSQDAHYHDNPHGHDIETRRVVRGDTIDVAMAPGGGVAIRITPLDASSSPYPSS